MVNHLHSQTTDLRVRSSNLFGRAIFQIQPAYFPALSSPVPACYRSRGPNPGQASDRSGDIILMGRGALLWLLGIPLPIVILIVLFWR